MRKLRLLLFKECNRNCEGCCNKYWNLDNIQICNSFKDYDEIILTGGEPMLRPDVIKQTVNDIKKENNKAKIYMYTAYTHNNELLNILKQVDGLTLTLHDESDILPFWKFHYKLIKLKLNKSLRLNIFKPLKLYNCPTLKNWKIKNNITWDKGALLPTNEVFMRLEQA